MSVLFYYFGWPDGAVYSNVIAAPICFALGFAAAYPLRHHIGRRVAAYAHEHYTAHLKELEGKNHDSPHAG